MQVASALKSLNLERLTNSFLELTRIATPSKSELPIAEYLTPLFRACGAEVTIDNSAQATGSNTGNFIAHLPAVGQSDAQPLVFTAHMDTVGPCAGIEPYLDNDKVFRSAGDTILGADDRVGIAAILELFRVLHETQEIHPPLYAIFTVQEEIGLIGAKNLKFDLGENAACFVLDGDEKPGEITNCGGFHYGWSARITGCASHAGVAPEKGINAICAAAQFVSSLPQGKPSETSTFNTGTIQGGSADNVVAESCVVTGEFRSYAQSECESFLQCLENAKRSTQERTGCAVELDYNLEYAGFDVPDDDPLISLVARAAQNVGLPFASCASLGGTDANFYCQKGLRPLVLGTGMTDFHSTSESLAQEDLFNVTALILEIVRQA